MRSGISLVLALAMFFLLACGQGAEVPQKTLEPSAPPVVETVVTDEEQLQALDSDATAKEIGVLCLRLRKSSGSLPSNLRQRCAQALLSLAAESDPSLTVSTPADILIDLAIEFGATSAAVSKTKKAGATKEAEQRKVEATSSAIENASFANPADVRQAEQLLASLPSACNGSRASATRDGTVTIRLLCQGNNKSMDGSIKIKDGIVTEIQ